MGLRLSIPAVIRIYETYKIYETAAKTG
jgi:hypothetical protein